MSKDKKIVTQLEVQAIIDKAQKDFVSLSKEVDLMWQKSHPPKTVSKQLADLELRLASLQKMAEKTEIFPSDMSQITGDAKAFTKEVHNLTLSFKLLTDEQKKAMLGKDIAESLDKRRKALKDYDDIVKKNALNQEEWNKLQNQKTQKEDILKQARQELEAKEQLLDKQQKNIQYAESYAKKLQKIQNLTNSIAAAEEELKGIDQEKAPKTYQKKQGQISKLKDDRTQAQKDLDEDKRGEQAFKITGKDEKIKQTQQDIETLKETIKQSETSIKDFSKQMEDLIPVSTQEALKDLVQALKLLGVSVDNEGETIESLTDKVETLEQEAIKPISEACQKAQNNLTELGEGAKQVGDKVDECTEDLKKQEEVLKNEEAFNAKIKQFLGMAGAVEILKRSLRNAFETTKQLDKAMTEMAVVTDLQVGDYWEQLPEHTKRASELGVAIKEVYEAETLYYQQGLKTESAQALANETLKMARIAGLDAAEATDKMTAALRGFNMELNEASAQKVSDVYSELAAITAADVNEISSAMTKTASIASSAGMEFETTAAFLSQIIETTRESAETAGTAMKTVIARFQELKKSPGEIGEIDGEIVDANAIETALRSVGVSLRDSTGQFRELDEVFLELSSKWDSLDKNTQRYIATIAAGSRQQSRFIAMMSDYGRTQELVVAANNSAGASQRQYEKTLESLETKLAKLKNAWDEFSMGILESDLVKFGVDVLTKFLEIINKATSAFDGLGGTIMKVLSTIALFKVGQIIFDKMKQPMYNFFAEIINKARETGEKAGDAAKEGLARSKKKGDTKEAKVPSFESLTSEKASKDKKTIKEHAISLKTNAVSFITGGEEGAKHREQASIAKAAAEAAVNEGKTAKANIGAISSKITDTDTQIAEKKKAIEDQKTKISEAESKLEKAPKKGKKHKKAQNNYNAEKQKAIELEKELQTLEEGRGNLEGELAAEQEKYNKSEADYNKHSQKFAKESQASWDAVGENISKAGQAIAGVGVGISMLGGLFSSLGLEEVGDAFSTLGTWVTFAGTAISGIGTLIPVVAKVAVAAGISVQAAWWWLVAIVAVLAVVIVGITAAIKQAQAAKLENRMKAAAEATEKAREAAEEAKKAYDDMVADRQGFDEMQKKLASLTKGTQEWKEALRESNAQVLELIKTYPELAQYVTRGDQGQLTIADEGWDAMISEQAKKVGNAQNASMFAELEKKKLELEGASQDYTKQATVYRMDSEGNQYEDYAATAGLKEDLEQIYLVQGDYLTEQSDQVAEIAKQWNITEQQVMNAAQELGESKDKMLGIAEEAEAIARATLTANASEEVLGSDFGTDAIDAFANSVNSDYMEAAIDDQVAGLKEDSDYRDSEEFNRLAEEYGVKDEMTGSDTEDLQKLYAAVMGLETIEDIPDAIAEDREKMLEAIARADQGNKLQELMKDYTNKLETLALNDAQKAENVGGLLTDEGLGMTAEYAQSFMDGDTFNRDKLTEEAAALGYKSIDAWAEALGKTTEEFYDEVEQNVRDNIAITKSTYTKLNRAFKKEGEETISSLGKGVDISVQNQANLADKLVQSAEYTSESVGSNIMDALNEALSDAGEDADKMAEILGTMNWNSADDWAELPTILNSININTTTDSFQNFLKVVQASGIAIKTVNFDTITDGIQNIRNLIKDLEGGEQGRVFEKEAYELLISSNKDLADEFVQIGNEFHYLGGSMNDLTDALKQKAADEARFAAKQLESQLEISNTVLGFEEAGATTSGMRNGQVLSIDDENRKDWDKAEKRKYLEEFQSYAIEQGLTDLSFVTDENGKSLGLGLATNFENLDEEKLDQYLDGLKRLQDSNIQLSEDTAKKVSEANIAAYTLQSASSNAKQAQDLRSTGKIEDEKAADEYSKALSIQAGESGMVADAVIAQYNELTSKNFSELNDDQKKQLEQLEKTMVESIEEATVRLEDIKTVNDMTRRVADALYNIGQNEIDKLSQLNDSVNEANEKLVSKIQEQIDDTRQARENEKKEEQIGDKQARLSYLMRDTSGANDLEIKSLQKEIEQDQESYGDDLVDQSLQKLSDDNEKAAEQRERQIEIMQASLDYDKESGNLARKAEEITNSSLAAINSGVDPLDTAMGNILTKEAEIKGDMATSAKQTEFNQEFTQNAKEAADSYDRIVNASEETEENTDDTASGVGGKEGETGIDALASAILGEIQQNQEDKETRKQAAKEAADALNKGYSTSHSEYQAAKQKYLAAGGSEGTFAGDVQVQGGHLSSGSGAMPGAYWHIDSDHGYDADPNYDWDEGMSLTVDGKEFTGLSAYAPDAERKGNSNEATLVSNQTIKSALNIDDVSPGTVVLYKGVPYIYHEMHNGKTKKWAPLWGGGDGVTGYATGLAAAMKAAMRYETGGLADFTGPAWLDGTKSRPELVLNARDTQNFIQLKDILAEVMSRTVPNDSNKTPSGDNYFDINISVESLSDDYDVEQLADKIRSMIYNDSMYRNVNTVNLIR